MSGRQDFLFLPRAGSDTLLIAFSGYGMHGAPRPPMKFEWQEFLRPYDCHLALVIDSSQHWFLGAVSGLSADPQGTASAIRACLRVSGARRVITMGSSMGGFAALLFGAWLQADLALAFAAQTSVEGALLGQIGDDRWVHKIAEINDARLAPLDLRPLFTAGKGPRRSWLLFDAACRLDHVHAARLEGLRGVRLRDVGYGDHEVAYSMAKGGALTELVAAALSRRPQDDEARDGATSDLLGNEGRRV